jgi:hypothetical protein
MSKDNTLLLVAAAAAALFIMSKKAKATGTTAAQVAQTGSGHVATNVNNQLWANVLGGAWKSLVSPDSGNTNFLMRNPFGQVVTSDGKPVDSVYSDLSDTLSTGGIPGVDVSAPDGTDWLANLGW